MRFNKKYLLPFVLVVAGIGLAVAAISIGCGLYFLLSQNVIVNPEQ